MSPIKPNNYRPDLAYITRLKRSPKGFSFPHPVNEVAARWVAGMVAVLTLTIIVTNLYWLIFVLAYGFFARVLTGPKLSPMDLLATLVLVPRFGNHKKLVAGPPPSDLLRPLA